MARAARIDSRIDVALGAACAVAALVCLALPTATRDSFGGFLRRTIVAPLVTMQEKAELIRTAFLARDQAMRVADSVTLRSQRLAGVEQENERLRRLLGLGGALKWGFVPAEVLQGRGVGEEFTVTLSSGSREGVVSMSPVVAPEGLVGMVERTDQTMSIAILWPHPDFRVSAMAADGSAYGIVQAHQGQGAERLFLELRSVPLRTALTPGTVIVSSGLGGTYPRGIPVGTVVSELRTPEQWAKSYLLRPVVALPDVAAVLVIRPDRARAGVEGVWALPKADSAARGVVGAADSLKRLPPDTTKKKAP